MKKAIKIEKSEKGHGKAHEKKENRAKEAMEHSNKLGAGAAKRKSLKGQEKVSVVMKEFKRGTLHSGGSGKIVKNPKQAIAIALSEAKMSKKKK